MTKTLTHRPVRLSSVLLCALLMLLIAGCGTGTTRNSVPTTNDATPPTAETPPQASIQEPAATVVATPTTGSSPASEPADEEETPTPEPTAQEVSSVFNPDNLTLSLQPVLQGLTQPLYVTHAGDGTDRLFVVEKPGRILVYGPDRQEAEVFLDIQQRVGSSGFEQGLLGLAFAPDYAESGAFFVNYTDRNGDTVVARYIVSPDDPDRADPASESVILTLDQPASNHNGGMLLFGPDDYLYIGTGDGGRANDVFGNAQNPQTLLGAMLRIDVSTGDGASYAIPPENPWTDQTLDGQEVRDEIWAIGLRNPWRYSFDRATGDLWIADVGQNQFEEVNLVDAADVPSGGLNFGWPIMEGLHCFQATDCQQEGLVLPVIEYDHSRGCSVTGGYVYRGQQFPALQGVYIFGDYCSGLIWASGPAADGALVTALMLESGLAISSFGEDEGGELYLTDLNGGVVYQVQAEE